MGAGATRRGSQRESEICQSNDRKVGKGVTQPLGTIFAVAKESNIPNGNQHLAPMAASVLGYDDCIDSRSCVLPNLLKSAGDRTLRPGCEREL